MSKPITRFVKWIKKRRKTRALFYKALLICVEFYAMALIGMSYYLAYLGQTEVLESLSQTITKVIVYPFLAFTINRTIENFAEHNSSKFHTPLSEEPIKGDDDDDNG